MKKQAIHTEIYKIKKNSSVGFSIYELNTGKYYGIIMTMPSKITKREFAILETEGGEFTTDEQNSKNDVLKIIFSKLQITDKDIELSRSIQNIAPLPITHQE